MDLEELDKRKDLHVDLDKLAKEMDTYLTNVTREELKEDLTRVGLTFKKIKGDE